MEENDDVEVLPRHLATLAREVLNRGTVLSTCLEEDVNHRAKAILR
jgi:hypothetical protein